MTEQLKDSKIFTVHRGESSQRNQSSTLRCCPRQQLRSRHRQAYPGLRSGVGGGRVTGNKNWGPAGLAVHLGLGVVQQAGQGGDALQLAHVVLDLDRKSTRLNSSH